MSEFIKQLFTIDPSEIPAHAEDADKNGQASSGQMLHAHGI